MLWTFMLLPFDYSTIWNTKASDCYVAFNLKGMCQTKAIFMKVSCLVSELQKKITDGYSLKIKFPSQNKKKIDTLKHKLHKN